MERQNMINKKSYRQYLEQRMDRLTPVLAGYETVSATSAPKKNKRGLLFSLIGAGAALVLAIAIIVPINLASSKKGQVMSLEERDYMSARVYNAAIKNDDTIPYVDYPWESNYLRNDGQLYYDQLTVVDSYYIQTSYQENLADYFGKEIIGQKMDTVVALLDLSSRQASTSEKMNHMRVSLIVLHYGNTLHGFIGGTYYFGTDTKTCTDRNSSKPILADEHWPCSLSYDDEIEFSSAYFLSPHHLASDDGHDNMVNIVISGNTKKNFTIKTFYVNMTKPNEDIESTIYPESYKQMGKEETINLIEQVTVTKQEGHATISSIDKNHWILSVASQELPSLKTLRFLKLIANGVSYDYDPQGLLKEGSVVAYDYYERYANYAPTDLLSTEIRLK
jgi:hypothetical protein